ncbi:unnamed protein product [Closterium sp. Yama58-4]|nr:unnamed protein product [Closterium sp. Yama58-4]
MLFRLSCGFFRRSEIVRGFAAVFVKARAPLGAAPLATRSMHAFVVRCHPRSSPHSLSSFLPLDSTTSRYVFSSLRVPVPFIPRRAPLCAVQSATPLRAVPGFSGMLSSSEEANPGLFNWNLAMPIYCDGGGYAGTAGRVQLPGKGNNSIYLDGYNVTRTILADLLAVRGLASARRVLVAGASAGGQAVTAWCERVAAMVPGAVTKCLVDSGIFLDAKDRTGAWHFRQVTKQMTTLHRAQGNDKCMQAEWPSTQWRCFFPQYTLPFISTPVFLLSPLLDHRALILGNQIRNDTGYAKQCISSILRSTANLTHAMRYSARRNAVAGKIKVCTPEETNAILAAGNMLLTSVKAIVEKQPTWVAYIPASAAHCYTYFPSYSEVSIQQYSLTNIVADWALDAQKQLRLQGPIV